MSNKRYNPNSYPKAVRDRVEIDYASKLSDAEQTWLAAFNESEYGANPELLSEITGQPVTQAEKRRKWRQIKKYQRDTMSQPARLEVIEPATRKGKRKTGLLGEQSLDSHSFGYSGNPEDAINELLDKHAEKQNKDNKHVKK